MGSLFAEMAALDEASARDAKADFVERMREALAEKKMSDAELARRIGTSPAAVHRLLDSTEHGVRLVSLVAAARAVGWKLLIGLKHDIGPKNSKVRVRR
jgi:hypothetical protein